MRSILSLLLYRIKQERAREVKPSFPFFLLLGAACLGGCHTPPSPPPPTPPPVTRSREESSNISRAGHAPIEHFLAGWIYHEGLGVERDDFLALYDLRKAALEKNDEASLLLGLMYHQGDGVPRDDVKACMWLYLSGLPDRNEEIRRFRGQIAALLTPVQLEAAKKMAAALKESGKLEIRN